MNRVPPTPKPAQLRADRRDQRESRLASVAFLQIHDALLKVEQTRVLRDGRKAQFPSRRFSEQVRR